MNLAEKNHECFANFSYSLHPCRIFIINRKLGIELPNCPTNPQQIWELVRQRSVNLWDVMTRIRSGLFCLEKDFDLKMLAPALQEVIEAHDIRCDPESPVPSDDSLADDVYEAALELYLEVGTYVTDARRCIKFEEEYIENALKLAPAETVFGEGKDASTLTPRKIEDKKPPFCMFGAGSPVSEDIYLNVLQSYAKEPLANTFSGGIGLNTVGGMAIGGNTPSEIYASVLNAILTRQAAIEVGKPKKGIHNVVGSAVSTAAIIAANQPEFGIRKTDGFLVASLPELKIDYERLNKVAYLLTSGNIIGALYGPIMGGYAGGPEGTAVVTVATAIQNSIFYQPHYQMCFPIHMTHLCNTTRELLWVISMVGQAISRNTHLLVTVAGELSSGPCTDMVLYEATAYSVAGTVSGLSLMAVEVANNRYLNHCTGMEARMAAEAGHAIARSNMKRDVANELIKNVLKKYEDKIEHAPMGKSFRECYDTEAVTPSDEYLGIYDDAVRELRDLGLEI